MNTSFDILKHDLSRFLPIRVVFRKDGDKLKGLIENSFSMDLSDTRVRIWWSGKAYSFLGEHDINGIEDAEQNSKSSDDLIIDPFADDSPIDINWEEWFNADSKFRKRNAPFRLRESV